MELNYNALVFTHFNVMVISQFAQWLEPIPLSTNETSQLCVISTLYQFNTGEVTLGAVHVLGIYMVLHMFVDF